MVKRALEILTDDPNRVKPFLVDVYPVVGCSLFGFACASFMNVASRRPILSGIQYHFMAAAAGALIGKTIDGWRNDHMAERDAVLRRYVELHPDDFPDPAQKVLRIVAAMGSDPLSHLVHEIRETRM